MESGGRRSGGLFHGEVAHGRGADKPAAPRGWLRTPTAATRGGRGGSRTDTAVDECRNEMIGRVATVAVGVGSTSR